MSDYIRYLPLDAPDVQVQFEGRWCDGSLEAWQKVDDRWLGYVRYSTGARREPARLARPERHPPKQLGAVHPLRLLVRLYARGEQRISSSGGMEATLTRRVESTQSRKPRKRSGAIPLARNRPVSLHLQKGRRTSCLSAEMNTIPAHPTSGLCFWVPSPASHDSFWN